MSFKIENRSGYNEVIIYDDCSFENAYAAGKILIKNFNIFFTQKIEDLESFYWDFEYQGSKLTLHYNVFVGLSIFPLAAKEAGKLDNENAKKIGGLLFKCLNENNLIKR
jgi:hypothetical protein